MGPDETSSPLSAWRRARASRARLIVDAETYFAAARRAMMAARSDIFMLGWDFDTRVRLDRQVTPKDGDAPTDLGPFISWLAQNRPDLKIRILRWDVGALKALVRGTTIFRLLRWMGSGRVRFRLDGAHPPTGSHHEKILVIDDQLAFCGGIDMTIGRWDTRDHADGAPGRRPPGGGEPLKPWHDATMALEGEAAAALGDLARERWRLATGEDLPPPAPGRRDLWPRGLSADFDDVEVAIARTRGACEVRSEVREVEALHLEMIGAARRFGYFESQYFASPAIAQAMAERLAEPDGPEFVVVHPRSAEGWLQSEAMDSARARLLDHLRKGPGGERLRLYCPCTEGGAEIYVHAKIAVVDDAMLRVGSANMNNRSLGLDSECDVVIDARGARPAEAERRGVIEDIRLGLLAEHLGVTPDEVRRAETRCGSLIGAIESLRSPGRSLRPYEPEELGALDRLAAVAEPLDPEGPLADAEPMTAGGWRRLVGDRLRGA